MEMVLTIERRDLVEALSAVTARRSGIEGGMKRLPQTPKGAQGRARMEAEITRLRRCEDRLREAVDAMA